MTLIDRRSGWSPLDVEGSYDGLSDVSPVTVGLGIPAWTDRARCRDAEPELFFPERGARPFEAVRICRTCPVRGDCLAFALEIEAAGAVMGGMSDSQRRAVRLLGDEDAQEAA